MRNFTVVAAGSILGMLASVALAVSPTEVDTFQDGTVENWGGGVTVTNIADGGPLGVGDRYLQVDSTNRLATFNQQQQWSGDFQSAGVLDIDVDLLNTNGIPLDMRIVLFSAADTRFTSTIANIVPNDSLWHHYTFSLREADLTIVNDTGTTYANLITNVDRMMIRYDASLGAGGTPFVGSLGIDNVTAVVPEPASVAAIALLPLLARRRRA